MGAGKNSSFQDSPPFKRLSPPAPFKIEGGGKMKKSILQALKEAEKKGEIVGVTFTFYNRPGHTCSGKILVLTESYLQLEGSHEIYFDQPHFFIEEIRIRGKTIYRRPAK